MKQEAAKFITSLTRINPDIKDEELFEEIVSTLSYDLQKLLFCTNINNTEEFLEFLEKQDSLQGRKENGFRKNGNQNTERDNRNKNYQDNFRNEYQNEQKPDDQKNRREYGGSQNRTKNCVKKDVTYHKKEDNKEYSWKGRSNNQSNICLETSQENTFSVT